jgi:hypothetical protein
MKLTDNNEWVELKGAVTADDIRALADRGHMEKISLTHAPLLTAEVAQGFESLPSVSWLWLWCDVTRAAMRSVVATRGLKILDVLSLASPGKLEGFALANSLEEFRGNHALKEQDLLEVATCQSLREIGAQGASLSMRVIQALLGLPKLESLDLEATAFDDAMAQEISSSQSLVSLDLGATRLTAKGLKHICRMRQLRSLDLWATRIDEEDLELLQLMPNLEYISVGGMEGGVRLDAKRLIIRLAAIPSLQRVWLDGVIVSPQEKTALESRFSKVRLT